MIHYLIQNITNKESYKKQFKSITEAKHWVINHLDLSLCWYIGLDIDELNKNRY